MYKKINNNTLKSAIADCVCSKNIETMSSWQSESQKMYL